MSNCANCGQYVSSKRTFSTRDNFNRRFCCSSCKKEFYSSRPIQKFAAIVVGAFLIIFVVVLTLNETVPGAKDSMHKASNKIENQIIKSIDKYGSSEQKKSESILSDKPEKASYHLLDKNNKEIKSSEKMPEVSEKSDEITSRKTYDRSNNDDEDSVQIKIAELKADLAEVETKIESERDRWKASINVINQLTNFKKTPVREGSPQYHQCMEASRIINEVEAGAPNLKSQRARIQAMIQSLENE